ncbi:hypothetical protein GH733_017109, partial [Mirounga leonina]
MHTRRGAAGPSWGSDTATAGVWSCREWAEEEDVASGARRGMRVATPDPGGGARRPWRRTGREGWTGGGGGSRRHALRLEGGVNAGSASAPCSAPPAPTSGTARGTPTSHADDSTARRAPLANEACGSLHPAHTEAAHRLCSFSGLLCQINYRRGLAFALGLSLRAGGVVFGYDPALGPRQGPSLRLGLRPRKPASLRLQTLGESLHLCSQTPKRVSSGPALDFSFSPSPTSQDTLTPGCRTDTQTLSEGQRSLNKEP